MESLEAEAKSEDEAHDRKENIEELLSKVAAYEESCEDIEEKAS